MSEEQPLNSGSPKVMVVREPRNPGSGALAFSICGFFGITAIIGVILGFVARAKAKKSGQSTAMATSAVVIGAFWLLIFAIIITSSASDNSATSTSTSQPIPTASSTSNSKEPVEESTQDKTISYLKKQKFKCSAPSGIEELVQCRKGSVKVPVYGTQPKELANIELGTGSINGYALPATVKALSKFGVESEGDDGSGFGTEWFSN